MSETNEAIKKQSGGSGIGWVLLLILGVLIAKGIKSTTATETTDDTASGGGGGGGGGGGYGGYYQDDVIVDIGGDDGSSGAGNGGSNGNGSGSSSGSVTPIKQAMTARTLDPEWQAQKARINMAIIPAYQKAQIEKGAVTKNTLKSIADYQAVKAGTMSAFDYANDPNMPEEMRAGIEYSSTAYQTSATTVRNRALAYYSGVTGSHRGGMSADERTAWDSANEKAALEAYAAAAGSGNQATVAASMAAKLGGTSLSTPPVKDVKKTTSTKSNAAIADDPMRLVRKSITTGGASVALGKGSSIGSSGLKSGRVDAAADSRSILGTKTTSTAKSTAASKGSAQPGKGSSSSTAKTATRTVAKAAATKGISGAVKAAASLSKK